MAIRVSFALSEQKQIKIFLTCLIHAFSLMQMQGAGTRRHSYLFQGFRNEADALK